MGWEWGGMLLIVCRVHGRHRGPSGAAGASSRVGRCPRKQRLLQTGQGDSGAESCSEPTLLSERWRVGHGAEQAGGLAPGRIPSAPCYLRGSAPSLAQVIRGAVRVRPPVPGTWDAQMPVLFPEVRAWSALCQLRGAVNLVCARACMLVESGDLINRHL